MSITIAAGQSVRVDVELTPLGVQAEIWGYIVQEGTNIAIQGALVQLLGVNSYSQSSGPDGYYKVGPVEPGDYSLIVSMQGYETKSL